MKHSFRKQLRLLPNDSKSLVSTEDGPRPGVLTGARHGSRVRFGAEVSLVADAGSGSLPDGVAVERALGAGAVGGQGAVVADLTGWKKQENRQEVG